MTDKEIIQGLINREYWVTALFFLRQMRLSKIKITINQQ